GLPALGTNLRVSIKSEVSLMTRSKEIRSSRREFIKTSTVGAAGTALASRLSSIPAVYPAGNDQMRIGLVGCGGRGTGAADNVLEAAPNVKLVAMGDVLKDRLDGSLKRLMEKQTDR